MGLDMYLYANKFLCRSNWGSEEENKMVSDVAILMNAEEFLFPKEQNNCQFAELKLEIGYWRKANAIHNFFVTNIAEGVDNCEEMDVSLDHLKDLKDRCEKVLANHDLASELLPPLKGFFFGSTDYDEWYYSDLKETLVIVNRAIEHGKSNWDFTYRASW